MRSTKQSTTTEKTSTEKPETSQQTSRGNSVNQVTLVGRLVADPRLRETGNGKHVTTVRIATNNGASAQFHNVVLWGQLADFAAGYLKKGRLVYVAGRIQTRSWTAADGAPATASKSLPAVFRRSLRRAPTDRRRNEVLGPGRALLPGLLISTIRFVEYQRNAVPPDVRDTGSGAH